MKMGNVYLRLKRTDDAIAAYTKAAPLASDPGLAYFNLCAILYNTGQTDGALAACNKAIAADPGRADAYFVKGSVLVAQSTVKDGKAIAPPGTIEALQKYLELAPNGPHAKDVRDMLDHVK
jgi:tetratricopeptide (TPR) repeat protein